MSRPIEPGDFVRITHPQGQVGDFIIQSIEGMDINVYPLNQPDSISRLIGTSRGYRIEGDERTKYTFEFFTSLPIQELFSPQTPQLHYKPLVSLSQFDFRTVKDWLDNWDVRINLFEAYPLKVMVFPFSLNYARELAFPFRSPYREQYQNYILTQLLPGYIDTERKSLTPGQIEANLTEQLLRAAFGALVATPQDVYYYFESVFPHLQIQRVADDGDCYYSAIGLHDNRDSTQVRADLAGGFTQLSPGDQTTIVRNSIGECPQHKQLGIDYARNRNEVVRRFPDILQIQCNQGKQDCGECLWGGNFLDEVVYLVYRTPVISVGISPEQQETYRYQLDDLPRSTRLIVEMVLDRIQPSFWDRDHSEFRFEDDQPVLFVNSYPMVSGREEDELMSSPSFIGYIATSGKHVDGIIPRVN